MDFTTLFRACTCEDNLHHDSHMSSSSDHSASSSNSPSSILQSQSDQIQNHLIAMHYNLGCSLQEQNKFGEAIQCYRNALKIDPNYCDAQYNLANALQLSGQFEDAEQEYLKTIALDPHHQLAYYNLGYLYFNDLKDPWKGIAMLKKSLEIDPRDVDAQINMALALNDLGMLEDVIKCYQYIIEHNSDCVMAYFNLGNAYLDVGNIDEALNCFQVTSTPPLSLPPLCSPPRSKWSCWTLITRMLTLTWR